VRDWLLRAAVRRSLTDVRHVVPVRPGSARHLVADVYGQLEREFGVLAPPVALHSPEPTLLAACWVMLRETLVAQGRVNRAAKEAVAAAVSLGNACPYCVEVHSTAMRGLTVGPAATAIGQDRIGSVRDPGLRRLAQWARASAVRADTTRPGSPFPPEQAAELIGVAVTFHYINRMVNVFLGESPIPTAAPTGVRDALRRMLSVLMRHTARRPPPAGAALDLLPAAPLPVDLRWAAGNEPVADAFGRAVAAVEAAGRRALAEPVRVLVTAAVSTWDGRPTGPSRGWADDAVAGLLAAQRPAGRLALLTALAPYQATGSVIDEFRRDRPDDAELISVTAWASLTAARRVGSWMWTQQQPAAMPMA
jgi:AhpD family alkylhydroperoxidase